MAGFPVGAGAFQSRNWTPPPPWPHTVPTQNVAITSRRIRPPRRSRAGIYLPARCFMRVYITMSAAALAALALVGFGATGLAQSGPYKVLKTAKVGGTGAFDYVYADTDGR